MKEYDNLFVSIVIITYNEEKYLPRLLDSLLIQTFDKFEIIISDSNSIDSTIKIAEGYQKKFNELRILKLTETRGPAYGRNQGALLAKYERILFLDADTRIGPRFMEQITNSLIRNSADVATCPIRIAEGGLASNLGAVFLNFFMIALRPFYSAAYGACFITTRTVHNIVDGFLENLAVCEDCNYVKRARRNHGFSYRVLRPIFYTSDRRAQQEGGFSFMFKYIRIHLYRMFTGKEILKGVIAYNYGEF